jgi:hypothetical protein
MSSWKAETTWRLFAAEATSEVPPPKKNDLTSKNLDSIRFNIWLNGIYSWFMITTPSHRCWKYLGTIWTPGNILETWFYSFWCYEYFLYWYVVCFVLWRMSNKKWDSKQMHVWVQISSPTKDKITRTQPTISWELDMKPSHHAFTFIYIWLIIHVGNRIYNKITLYMHMHCIL